MIKFSERLKELRQELHLSQNDVAKELSSNQRTVSGWEKGIREPNFEMLEKLAKFFDVTVGYLLGVED